MPLLQYKIAFYEQYYINEPCFAPGGVEEEEDPAAGYIVHHGFRWDRPDPTPRTWIGRPIGITTSCIYHTPGDWREQPKYQTTIKKHVLLELERKIIRHPHAAGRMLDFEAVLVQTQNPDETDMSRIKLIQVWVRADWVEPLTRTNDYVTEAKQELLATLRNKWEK